MAGVTHLTGKFAWLADEPGPKMLVAALKLLGIQEKAGASDNPTILAWAKDLGIEAYKHDATPWCGLFVAYVAHKAGKPVVKDPLWAKNWLNWGSCRKAQRVLLQRRKQDLERPVILALDGPPTTTRVSALDCSVATTPIHSRCINQTTPLRALVQVMVEAEVKEENTHNSKTRGRFQKGNQVFVTVPIAR